MAIKSTVFKAELQVNDLDRHYYQTHALTLARHPSETDERMMIRLLAFALNADPQLAFGGDVGTQDEPSLWCKDLTGAIRSWIEVGLPEPRLLRKAAGRSDTVMVYAYGRAADLWWNEHRNLLSPIDALAIWKIPTTTSLALAALARRSMQLQCLVQDGDATFSDGATSVTVERVELKPAR
ncbi:MAG: YaeQ family protein [Proteobacteria bacterium]|nr:YaeQ family protein [Burkholderiales bacterium]